MEGLLSSYKSASTLYLSAAAVVSAFLVVRAILNRSAKQLSGPPGVPFLGNILDFDASKPYLAFTEWKAKYGASSYRLIAQLVDNQRPRRYLPYSGSWQ